MAWAAVYLGFNTGRWKAVAIERDGKDTREGAKGSGQMTQPPGLLFCHLLSVCTNLLETPLGSHEILHVKALENYNPR